MTQLFEPSRRRTRVVLGLALTAGLVVGAFAPQSAAKEPPSSFADLAEKLLPSVVNISTTQVVKPGAERGPEVPNFPPGSPFDEFFREYFDRQQRSPNAPPRRATSLGSGFIVDAAGIVVTNNHVIEGAQEVSVILHDDVKLTAEVIGRDDKTDLAVLRVKPTKPLTAVKWGPSDKARVGDWVVAIGNPFGLGGSVTAGILSARQRDIQAGPYDDFLQTDASINKGNSGGPMFNLEGQVIGVNTAIISPSGGSVGIGFAVPSDLARSVVEQIVKHGRVRRGWLGVRIQQVTDDIAESMKLPNSQGALVASVSPKGPAANAGIESGDVVVRFDGKPVESMRRLPRMVAETEIDRSVDVVVIRKGKEVTTKVKLGELEDTDEKVATVGDQPKKGGADKPGAVTALGMTLSGLTDSARKQYGLGDKARGIVVTEVKRDSPAGEKDLQPGDVITEVMQEEVTTPEDFRRKVDDAKKSGKKTVLLLVDRKGELRYASVRADQG